jgi:hypothetical protein
MRYAARSGAVMRDLTFWAASMLLLSGCWLFHRAGDDVDQSDRGPDRRVTGAVDAGDAARDAGSRCTTRTLRKGERFEPVDMVWVVDSSRSMSDEQSRIQQTMNEFVSDAEARHFDVRLVMITDRNIVPAPLGSDAKRYRFVQRQVRSHEPLSALLSEWPRYADFLRPEAALHFVIVSDDDSDLPAADFKRELDQRLERPYRVHAVTSPDVGGQPCQSERPTQQCVNAGGRARQICGAAAIGRAYLELAEESGGEQISICVDDWRKVFGPLLEAVTPTDIPCSLDLGSDPELQSTSVEIQNGQRTQKLVQVAGPLSCNTQPAAYYFVDRSEGPQLTLCPRACSATMGDDVTLTVSTHCE